MGSRAAVGLAIVVLVVAGLLAIVLTLGVTLFGQEASVASATPVTAPATPAAPATQPARARVAPGPVCTAGSSVRLASGRLAYAVTVTNRAVAYHRPGAGRIAAFGRLNDNGVPTVFGVLGARVSRSDPSTKLPPFQ